MNRILRVTRLQLNKRDVSFLVPLSIILTVLLVTALIAFALQRFGLDVSSPGYAEGARYNAGMAWSLPGFLVYYGVQAVATTFPFAMALGATRRSYVLGTALANILTSLYVSFIMLVLLCIELATDHWFFGIYALDVYLLGSGDPWVLLPAVFFGTFLCTSMGGLFAAVWVRFGGKGPTVLGLGLIVLVAALVLIFVPQAEQIIAALTGPVLVVLAAGLAVLCLLGTWVSMRRTAVR